MGNDPILLLHYVTRVARVNMCVILPCGCCKERGSYWPVNEWFFQQGVIIAFLKWSRIQAYVLMCVFHKLDFLLLASQRFPTSVFSTLAKSHFCLFSAALINAINFVEKEVAFPKIFVNASLHCTL